MNVKDSQNLVAELVHKENYEVTSCAQEADLILINTCSVREKPESKLFSEIGQFAKVKKSGAKIGVCGCSASAMGSEIIRRAPVVDFVLGSRNISKISSILGRHKAVESSVDHDDSLYVFSDSDCRSHKAMINISIGCDKRCSYCIVPFTRGREISIPLDLILREAIRYASLGVKEIILLGQNVNNYGARFSSYHDKIDFVGLLRKISKIDGIERIRFTSPHPLHMNDEFLDEFMSNPKICKSLHIPLQSGSTKILKSMRRGYTREWYLDRISYIRQRLDPVGISTDIIVGFPGESDDDFLDTVDVLRQARFDTLYSFVYSPRSNTASYKWGDSCGVPVSTARRRLQILKDEHRKILIENSRSELGRVHKVLVDGVSDLGGSGEGRSDTNRLIKILGSVEVGQIVDVRVTDVVDSSLYAVPC